MRKLREVVVHQSMNSKRSCRNDEPMGICGQRHECDGKAHLEKTEFALPIEHHRLGVDVQRATCLRDLRQEPERRLYQEGHNTRKHRERDADVPPLCMHRLLFNLHVVPPAEMVQTTHVVVVNVWVLQRIRIGVMPEIVLPYPSSRRSVEPTESIRDEKIKSRTFEDREVRATMHRVP
mmetsp:Transcript_99267/g.196697  ORF Transcript_99267/g.196697 Transcript_99267/m.196697 type:complete len:178 (-) Transcript_99267:43-576(-)